MKLTKSMNRSFFLSLFLSCLLALSFPTMHASQCMSKLFDWTGPRRHQQQYQPVNSGLPTSVAQGKRPLKSALVRSNDDTRLSRSSNFGMSSEVLTDFFYIILGLHFQP